jgi:putative colanic acid biosysnthesis UDP-glucose lipid carrier transferase
MSRKTSKMSVLRPFSAVVALLQRALDACLIAVGLYGAGLARDHEWSEYHTVAAVAAAATFILIGEVRRLYGSWRLQSMDEEFRSVLIAWAITCGALIVAGFLLKVSSSYSRLATLAWFLTTPALLVFSRLAIRSALGWVRKSGANSRSVAVAGSCALADAVIQKLEETATFGVKVIGAFDDRPAARIQAEGCDASRRVGDLQDLVERARKGEVDYVFVALPLRAEARIVELVNRLADTTASVYVVPDLFVFDLMRARWSMLGTMPTVSVYESPFDGLNGVLKRVEDLVIGSLLLLLAATPMALIALGIVLTTRGPALFRQRRYGLNGKLVQVLKFRTMTTADDGADVSQASQGDTRVTAIGRFLRSSSLDELPQLLNVVWGDMSLVGPRPHAVAHNEEYRRLIHGYMLRHKVKPGITGWAQVNGWRGETDTLEKMQQRVEHDLEYLRNWSLWFDLRILFATVAAVVSRKNAY